jgi:hypothetical protein
MFALDDLYNNTQTVKPVTSTVSRTTTINNPNILSQFLTDFKLNYWAVEVNQWLLAFTVFYSFWFFMNFIFWKVLYHEGSLGNEQDGLESLNHLMKMWFSYLVYLAVWSVAIFNQGLVRVTFEWLSLGVAFIVLVGVDLPMIPVFGKFFGGGPTAAGNIFTQVWDIAFSLVFQLWQGILEAVGVAAPAPKPDKK